MEWWMVEEEEVEETGESLPAGSFPAQFSASIADHGS